MARIPIELVVLPELPGGLDFRGLLLKHIAPGL
jgi:hypothetical protein